MSSRWISISFSRSAGLRSRLMLACAAFTSEDFAHAARAPQQRVVGGKSVGETLGILDQDVAHPVDTLEQADIDAADMGHGRKPPVGMPDKGIGATQRLASVGGRRRGGKMGRDGLERQGNSLCRFEVRRRLGRWRPMAVPSPLGFPSRAAGSFGGLFRHLWPFRRRTLNGPCRGSQAAEMRGPASVFRWYWRRCNWGAGRYSPRQICPRIPRLGG